MKHIVLNSYCCGNSICHSREKPALSEAEWAGIQFFALDPCFRRGDIVDFRFPQQVLNKNFVLGEGKLFHFNQ